MASPAKEHPSQQCPREGTATSLPPLGIRKVSHEALCLLLPTPWRSYQTPETERDFLGLSLTIRLSRAWVQVGAEPSKLHGQLAVALSPFIHTMKAPHYP